MNISAHISKKVLALVVILFVISCTLIAWAIHPTTPTKITTLPARIPSPTPYQQTSLALTTSTTIPSESKVLLTISTTNFVTVVQAEIAFDPKVLQTITITPGTFFADPLVLLNDINYQTGRISYALGIKPHARGVSGQGTVATIIYSIVPTSTASATTLTFEPKTLATAENILPSVLNSITSITIPLKK